MTRGVAHWDTLDDSLVFWYAKGKIFLSILMANAICVHCSQLVDHCATQPCTS